MVYHRVFPSGDERALFLRMAVISQVSKQWKYVGFMCSALFFFNVGLGIEMTKTFVFDSLCRICSVNSVNQLLVLIRGILKFSWKPVFPLWQNECMSNIMILCVGFLAAAILVMVVKHKESPNSHETKMLQQDRAGDVASMWHLLIEVPWFWRKWENSAKVVRLHFDAMF